MRRPAANRERGWGVWASQLTSWGCGIETSAKFRAPCWYRLSMAFSICWMTWLLVMDFWSLIELHKRQRCEAIAKIVAGTDSSSMYKVFDWYAVLQFSEIAVSDVDMLPAWKKADNFMMAIQTQHPSGLHTQLLWKPGFYSHTYNAIVGGLSSLSNRCLLGSNSSENILFAKRWPCLHWVNPHSNELSILAVSSSFQICQ